MQLLEYLTKLYDTNNQLVLFGEAKNAGLLALNGAVVIGLATLYGEVPLWSLWWWPLTYCIACNVLSAFVALSALAAQKLPKETSSTSTPNDNYLFYGTVSHLTPEQLVQRTVEKYGLEETSGSLELDYARQVVIISQIVDRKFRRFNVALGLTIFGLTTPIGWFIYYKCFYPNRTRESK